MKQDAKLASEEIQQLVNGLDIEKAFQEGVLYAYRNALDIIYRHDKYSTDISPALDEINEAFDNLHKATKEGM